MSLKALTTNTAPAEAAHILAEDDAAIFQSIFGEDGVFSTGQKFKATVISNNKVRVADGIVCIGGHIARTVHGDYTDLTIENGVSGKNRNDLIVGRFSTTGEGGVDTMQLAVKKGTAGTTAADPAVTKGDLYSGSKLREVPLWRVKIEGLSIVKVEQLFKIIPTIPQVKAELDELTSNLQEAILIKTYEKDNVTIKQSNIITVDINAPVLPGYTRAMYWADCTNASSNGVNMSACNVYRVSISTGDDNVAVAVRNFANDSAKVKVTLRMLYVRNALV